MYDRYLEFPSYVKGGAIEPHWMADGSSFWYAEGIPDETIIYKIDPNTNLKEPLFDRARLRQALTAALGHEPSPNGLPFENFTFLDAEKAVRFTAEDREFILHLNTYKLTASQADEAQVKKPALRTRTDQSGGRRNVLETPSPDGRWIAFHKDHNLWLRDADNERSTQITTDGVEHYAWRPTMGAWSPDSSKLIVRRFDDRDTQKIPIVHYLAQQQTVDWATCPEAGGPIGQRELYILDVPSKRLTRVDTQEGKEQYIFVRGWHPSGAEIVFLRMSRDWKTVDLVAADATTGTTRVVLSETEDSFVLPRAKAPQAWLDGGDKFIWTSERAGWNQLYLFDWGGGLVRRLTDEAFPVTGVVAVDEKAGWVYFTGHGESGQPYDTHLYRVSLEGKDLSRLTEAPGQHEIQFSPSREFFIDTHSNPDRPPIVELRGADGTLLQVLMKADFDTQNELKWAPPEDFVVKAADGKTDLHGILYKPYDFQAANKYPVIEVIYAGPWDSQMVHRGFIPGGYQRSAQELAQLGFITFVVDGRGTPGRGKAFQDIVYGNVGQNEIPDHAAVLKQLMDARPYMDASRVGVFGHSTGGYFAIRAMLLAPDLYHVCVAGAPYGDVSGWWPSDVVPYLGLPQSNKESYDFGSNLRLVGNLKGKLLLIHGTNDTAVPLSHTMKMVQALARAGKEYDLVILPDRDHNLWRARTSYAKDQRRRYFQEHLKP